MIRRTFLALALFCWIAECNAAEFTWEDDRWWSSVDVKLGSTIRIIGDIEAGDFVRFVNILSRHAKVYPIRIQLHSRGGNLMEAMKIGDWIRDFGLVTVTSSRFDDGVIDGSARVDFSNVPEELHYACYSSCAIIWVAGAKRLGGLNTLGMHRPAYDDEYYSELNHLEASRKYSAALSAMEAYLEKMDVPNSVIDRSFKVSSSEIRLLSGVEIGEIRGDYRGYVPYMAEYMRSKCGNLSDPLIQNMYASFFEGKISRDEIREFELNMREINNCERRTLFNIQSDAIP